MPITLIGKCIQINIPWKVDHLIKTSISKGTIKWKRQQLLEQEIY